VLKTPAPVEADLAPADRELLARRKVVVVMQGNRIKEHAARRAPSVDRESTGLTAEQARGV
jgi:hypothetical protein